MLKKYLNTFCKSLILMISIALLSACMGPPPLKIPAHPPKSRGFKKPPDVAIVLGGGGARGYAHIGALVELQKAGIPIDLVVGSSVGAVIGSLYADRGDAFDAKSAMMNAWLLDFADFALPITPGLITGNALQWFVLKHVRALNFAQTKVPLVVVSTDLDSGMPYILQSGPIPPAVNASAALPGVARPVYLYGHMLVDGCMVSPVPVDIAKRYQPKVIIAIDICNDLDGERPNTSSGVYYRAYQISWNQLAKVTSQGADVIIHPHVGNGGTFEIARKYEFYDEGVKAARASLPKIKRLLANKHISLRHTRLVDKKQTQRCRVSDLAHKIYKAR